MKLLAATLIFALASTLALAQRPPVTKPAPAARPGELTDHEKNAMHDRLNDLMDLIAVAKAAEEKVQAAGLMWDGEIDRYRKLYNGAGCEWDAKKMRFHDCKDPEKK